MGLIDSLKNEAHKNFTKIESTQDRELETKLNKLHYLEKDIENELIFLKSVMTRGQETAERKGLHASAIIKPSDKFCLREQVLALFYKQKQGEQVSVGLKRIFTEGDAIHEKWQRLLIRGKYANPLDLDRTQFADEYDLQFTPDIICEIDGIKYVGEIKSVNTHQYQRMVKDCKPHASGKKQLQLYMYLTGIHKGFTLCEDKNTQEIKVNIYDYDEKEVKPYIKRLEQIQEEKERLLKQNKITKRHKLCTDYNCKMAESCAMREVCYKKSREKL